jgi:catechol 2,3-dioxygenase-like lactoylglutathione lyase family enzyme
MKPIPGVLETCLYVDDLPAAERFYGDVLGLALVSRQPGRHLFFRCGGAMVLLFRAEASEGASSEVPPHGARGPGHVAFAMPEREIDEWTRHLESCGVTIELRMSWPRGGTSIYFRDPAGNSLELATPRIWGIE